MPDASGEQWSTTTGTWEGGPVRLRLTEAAVSLEQGGESRSIPLAAVDDVRAQVGLLTGFVTFTVGDETITVSRVPKAEARSFVEALQALLRHLPAVEEPAPAPSTPDASPLAELERLGRLRESGVLTEEEFQAAKRTLLGRL